MLDNEENYQHNHFIFVQKFHILYPAVGIWRPIIESSVNAQLKAYIEDNQPCKIGKYREAECFAVEVPEDFVDHNFTFESLRRGLIEFSEEDFSLASRAVQFVQWQREHRFCGSCGAKTSLSETDQSLVCKPCGLNFYPKISPCVIGLVTRGKEFLLARSHRMREGIYSTLAGFIEPGENAEQAFAREVKEEVGINIKNIRYYGSQSWPFPGQLMIGFIADYESGELLLEENEIADANWYSHDNMPDIPPEQTISGQIIRHYRQSLINEVN